MLGAEQMIFNPAVLAALAAVTMGSFALWANPARIINRMFFLGLAARGAVAALP
jgi:hypothetical protein